MKRVSPREAHALITDHGYAYLDVRTVEEFEQGHPAGAYNVPLKLMTANGMVENPHFLEEVRAVFAPDARLVVGCAAGVRSLAAGTLLGANGYTDVVDQRAGMDGVRDAFGRVREPGWRAEGLPLSLSAEPGRSHADIRARLRRA